MGGKKKGVRLHVALLTGGGDKPYVIGLAGSLVAVGVTLDLIGSNELASKDLVEHPQVRFLNLRGDVAPNASRYEKVLRVAKYYGRLIAYAAGARTRIFHILWNNKIEALDRTVLMAYYRLLGRRVVMTVHNVNVQKRDGRDSAFNRLTLRTQYRLADHLFVHTELMKSELIADYDVAPQKTTVIPFGINESVPMTEMTPDEARRALGVPVAAKVLLFFGNIAPYKGLEILIEAFALIRQRHENALLLIAGRPKGHPEYWRQIERIIVERELTAAVTTRIEFIPDSETELYFKAADILVLPYLEVFQSGVLFLGYGFGLPVVASEVGSLKNDVIQGVTGWTCRPKDPESLAEVVDRHFSSDLFASMPSARDRIKEIARQGNSWATVARVTASVYEQLGKAGG